MRLDGSMIALVLSTLAACGTASEAPPPAPVAPAPLAPSTAPAARTPFDAVLAALPSATTIRITQGWMGMSPIAPLDHRYEVVIAGDAVTAHVVCRARDQETSLPDPTITASELAPILAQLATITAREGAYEARIEHTDDYPELTLEIVTPSGTALFFSRSQGRFADPWQLTVGSDARVVDSTIPGEALVALVALVHGERCIEWGNALR